MEPLEQQDQNQGSVYQTVLDNFGNFLVVVIVAQSSLLLLSLSLSVSVVYLPLALARRNIHTRLPHLLSTETKKMVGNSVRSTASQHALTL